VNVNTLFKNSKNAKQNKTISYEWNQNLNYRCAYEIKAAGLLYIRKRITKKHAPEFSGTCFSLF